MVTKVMCQASFGAYFRGEIFTMHTRDVWVSVVVVWLMQPVELSSARHGYGGNGITNYNVSSLLCMHAAECWECNSVSSHLPFVFALGCDALAPHTHIHIYLYPSQICRVMCRPS